MNGIVLFSTLLTAMAAGPQAERCAHHEASDSMMCVDRNGHCAEVSIDGQATTPLSDEATAKRVHAIPHGEDVCWQIPEPVSPNFLVVAGAGGIFPAFLGATENVGLVLYAIDDYDPDFDSRLDGLQGPRLEADGAGWRLQSDRPLLAGEYVAVLRISGKDNWDRQAVLLRIAVP